MALRVQPARDCRHRASRHRLTHDVLAHAVELDDDQTVVLGLRRWAVSTRPRARHANRPAEELSEEGVFSTGVEQPGDGTRHDCSRPRDEQDGWVGADVDIRINRDRDIEDDRLRHDPDQQQPE